MGYSKSDKAETHTRIVSVAAKRFRELGPEGIGVADVMKGAGVTVGGFYKHFDSRDELPVRLGSIRLRHQPGLSAGGERGIRTPDTRKGIHAFEARAFSHSAISPRPLVSFSFYQGSCCLRISQPVFTELSPAQPPHPSPRCG